MLRKSWPPLLLAALVIGFVGAAIGTIGGPGQARIEKNDAARYKAMKSLENLVHCIAKEDGALPDAVAQDARCKGRRYPESPSPAILADLTYVKESTTRFRICSQFEDAASFYERRSQPQRFDPDSGCIDGQIKSAP